MLGHRGQPGARLAVIALDDPDAFALAEQIARGLDDLGIVVDIDHPRAEPTRGSDLVCRLHRRQARPQVEVLVHALRREVGDDPRAEHEQFADHLVDARNRRDELVGELAVDEAVVGPADDEVVDPGDDSTFMVDQIGPSPERLALLVLHCPASRS